MRALVTGCAGFIGSHLTESLLDDGYEVVGVDCFNDNYGRRQKLGNLDRARSWDRFDFVPVDLARGQVLDLVEGCRSVFHLAAEPGVRSSWGLRFESYIRNNVQATQHLLEAASGVPGVTCIYASSSSVYGESQRLPTSEDVVPRPLSPYGVTKLAGEHLCGAYRENLGVRVVALRYFSVYGPRQRPDMAFSTFCRRLLEDQPIELYGGSQTRDFTFVSDVVAATRAAAENDPAVGNTFNIGGGATVALERALAALGEVSGREPVVTRVGPQAGDVADTGADIGHAERVLGYRPSVSLEKGLAEQWEWHVRNQPVGVTR
jgi:nucleoside-diphosphate-sugar epimerase